MVAFRRKATMRALARKRPFDGANDPKAADETAATAVPSPSSSPTSVDPWCASVRLRGRGTSPPGAPPDHAPGRAKVLDGAADPEIRATGVSSNSSRSGTRFSLRRELADEPSRPAGACHQPALVRDA